MSAEQTGSTKAPAQDRSPASVLQPAPMAPEGSAGSGGSSAAASPPAEPAPQRDQSAGSSPPAGQQASSAAATPPGDEALAPLRQLGRQLLQGWAEALATLAKLPGVGDMRVEALAARLQELSREASPAAAAAEGAASSAAGLAAATAAEAAAAAARGSLPAVAPPASELAGPNSSQKQAYSDPVDMFATAAKSAHLSYPELLHAFAASAEGLDDEALADYLFNLAMLCAEPPENELVVRPVLSLPQNSEEQQQYRRRQAAAAAAPVDALLAAMQQQQQGGGGGAPPRPLPPQTGLTHEAIWQQIVAQQQQAQAPLHGGYGGGGGRLGRGGSGAHHASPVSRSKSDMLSSYQQAQLAEAQGLQGLFRGGSASQQQFQAALQYNAAAAAMGPPSPLSPTRGLAASGGSPLAKAVSAPERDLWMTAASLAAEAEQKQHEAAAAAAAAAAASAEFSFHVQPASPTFGRLGPLAGAPGSGMWAGAAPGGGASGSGAAGVPQMRTLSDSFY